MHASTVHVQKQFSSSLNQLQKVVSVEHLSDEEIEGNREPQLSSCVTGDSLALK